jgi:hypothetical protein
MAWLTELAGALHYDVSLRAFCVFLIIGVIGVIGGGAVAWGREDRAPAVWIAGWALLAVAAAGLAVFGRR